MKKESITLRRREKVDQLSSPGQLILSGTSLDRLGLWKRISSIEASGKNSTVHCKLTVINDSNETLIFCWVSHDGNLFHHYPIDHGSIQDGSVSNSHTESTSVGHAFVCFRRMSRIPKSIRQIPHERFIFSYRPNKPDHHHKIVISSTSSRITTSLFCDPIVPVALIDTTTKTYQTLLVEGFTIRYEEGVFESYPELLPTLTEDLHALTQLLPPSVCCCLQQDTPLWLNSSFLYGPQTNPISPTHMCFHPSSDWLEENRMSLEKEGGVEVYSVGEYLRSRKLWGVVVKKKKKQKMMKKKRSQKEKNIKKLEMKEEGREMKDEQEFKEEEEEEGEEEEGIEEEEEEVVVERGEEIVPGGLLLHEYCHATHYKHSPPFPLRSSSSSSSRNNNSRSSRSSSSSNSSSSGYDYPPLLSLYETAMSYGLYESVDVHTFNKNPSPMRMMTIECLSGKHYACSNVMEFFAELSVAYLWGPERERERKEEEKEEEEKELKSSINMRKKEEGKEEEEEEEKKTKEKEEKEEKEFQDEEGFGDDIMNEKETKSIRNKDRTMMTTIEFNKWFPFNRSQLLIHDPVTCEGLRDVWERIERECHKKLGCDV